MAGNESLDSQISLWDLIYLGYSLHRLQHAKQHEPAGPTDDDVLGVVGHLRNWLEWIERLSLERSDRKVRPQLEEFVRKLDEALTSNPQAVLGDVIFELQAILADLYLAIESEAPERTAFMVLPAREIRVEDLLRKPEVYFGLTFSSPLDTPLDALSDFQEAARCFAAGFSAAAIVFTFRGTEAVLRTYFEKVTGQRPDKRATWGSLVKNLQEGSHNCPLKLLHVLSKLKDWRNQATHAGIREPRIWSDDAAQEALRKCREVVMRMSSDLEQR